MPEDNTDQNREKYLIPVDTRPMTAEWEAKMDRAAGRPTTGTRGYADTEAFNRDQESY